MNLGWGNQEKKAKQKVMDFVNITFFHASIYEIMLRQMRCGMGQWFLTFMGLLPLGLANKTVITTLFFKLQI